MGAKRVARPGHARGSVTHANSPPSAGESTVSRIETLQQTAGNRAVTTMLSGDPVVQREEPASTGVTLAPPTDATAPAEPAAPVRPDLAEGDGPNVDVGELQQKLNAVGAATPPLRITAVFGPETGAALRVFQTAQGLPPDGIAGAVTWARLDAAAPNVGRTASNVVENQNGADSMGEVTSASIHPTLRQGSSGTGVEELQQRLNNDPRVATALVPDGKFGPMTRRAVVEFQNANNPPLVADGIVGPRTWAVVDQIPGPVTVGRREFESFETIEGHRYGGASKYEWRLAPTELRVTIRIRFTGSPNHPSVATWLNDITRVWNGFFLVNDDPPNERLPLVFDPVKVSSGHDMSVRVIVDPPGKPGRSDTENWHTGDTDGGLAPHEFGHMMGLDDEYRQMHASYVETTGEEPVTGPVDGTGDPAEIAQQLRTAVTSTPASGRGAAAAAVVSAAGLRQGAFSQRVAQAYETAFAGDLRINLANSPGQAPSTVTDLEDRIPDGPGSITSNEIRVLNPFLYTNRSLMGDMSAGNVNDRTATLPKDIHQHPVQPRHVRQFLDFVRANRPGNWRLER